MNKKKATTLAWNRKGNSTAIMKIKLVKEEIEALEEIRQRIGKHITNAEIFSYLLTNFSKFASFSDIYDNIMLILFIFNLAKDRILLGKFSRLQQERLIAGIFLRDEKYFIKTLNDLDVDFIVLPLKSLHTVEVPFFVNYFKQNSFYCIPTLERKELENDNIS